MRPSFRGAGEAREPGIHNQRRIAVARIEQNLYVCGYGFRARRFAALRNDEAT
jgi:hypothetical protein